MTKVHLYDDCCATMEENVKLNAELIDLCAQGGGLSASPPPSVVIYQRDAPSELEAYMYEPVLCMVLQGAKMMRSGNHSVDVSAGNALVVSHHLPVISQITQASALSPYLAIVLTLNLTTLRELHAQMDYDSLSDMQSEAISCTPSRGAWVDPLVRYLNMVHDPAALSVLGPQVLREVHYRVLTSSTGAVLHDLLATDSGASRISRSINVIRERLSAPLRVPELAEQIGMSNSSFHTHFKAITGTTPLQFQKDLRLITAKDLLENGGRPVAVTAFEVGYESPTHFSRDYKRKFGHNPSGSK